MSLLCTSMQHSKEEGIDFLRNKLGSVEKILFKKYSSLKGEQAYSRNNRFQFTARV